MHQLLQSQPESAKSAPPVGRSLNHVGRSHIRQSYLTGCPSPAPSRAVTTNLLSKGPVNHLETTSSDGLVSNYSESYNRSAVGEKPALQLDDHLKNLLRELGHAINDTVSESDRITGAIAGVRAHGYDIVLKLDATIGLARRDSAANQQDSRLTTLDRRFLESLRIQVDQDSFNEAEPERKTVAKLTMTPQDIRFLKSLRIATDDSE